ncbi:hypothetical protein [Streptomyces sp. XD-27]|uniref:hypothetical protein n=1 Tax=Streptomyces sp. XD-27 TaxID=3062779 RepID=UPI0026F45A76|nr:hypothetical protein [Streptomyces sp. XD-27]WKX71913.1 hypothetical protein Q3Y56_20215 [Streptomyces sp. XD-27]
MPKTIGRTFEPQPNPPQQGGDQDNPPHPAPTLTELGQRADDLAAQIRDHLAREGRK